jgi:hypothetical protein
MSDPAIDQLQQLLTAERDRPDPSVERAEQVWSQVEARLDGSQSAPPWAPDASRPLWPWLVLGAVAIGVAGLLAARPSEAAAHPVQHGAAIALTAPSFEVPSPTLSPPAPAPAATEVVEASPGAPKTPSTTPAKPRSFADELALVERGRKALAAGRTAQVLAAMREHQRDFPTGALREEAAALRTAAKCGGQEPGAAAELADRFEARWTKSVHADLVRRHCR